MWRSLAVIVAGILQSQPSMDRGLAKTYAETVQRESVIRYIDPLTIVAMADHESRWIASVVGGKDGLCIGLVQHCLFKYEFCRIDYGSQACVDKKQQLLSGVYNLHETAVDITAWRDYCRRTTGRARVHHWLSGYGGYDNPERKIVCGQRKVKGRWTDVALPHGVADVLKRRANLVAHLG